jgi:hypothetical protein
MALKTSIQDISRFSDLIEFIGRDLEYEELSDQIKNKDFRNGVGSSKLLLSDGREVVRITQIPEEGKSFSNVKKGLRNRGPDGRELLNIIVYTDDESRITGEIHFMYHARNPSGEGIEYDLKYFSVDPQNVSPVYYEYLEDIKVNGRSISVLENEDSDDSLLETFSVDKITNNFYDDFHDLIQDKLEPSITGLPEGVTERHYSQLLTNRILFILFIQEKQWLSTETDSNEGQTDYLEQKYVEVKEQEDADLWKDFFKELFFNGLSKKGSSPEIVGTVPYLNGGLFEKRDYEDEVDVDSEFFEALLSPEEVNSFGKKKGFLRNYKISLSESNPSEQELVVDPEFIGRVFEMSMQDTEERGEKGAFYTPKDITQYMSKNSIKQLLLNELPEKEEEISQLVLSHEIKENFTEEELQTIHDELKDINVLDPAVGSGAFIIAVMEELVGIFEAINPEIGEEEDTYDLKEHMIANNLYGVDIDQAGIELCKFRTWLHLMQDLEVDLETLKEQNDKYALPNLDFKFFVGNSLSGDYKPIEAIDEIKNTDYQKTLDSDPEETNLIGKIQNKRAEFTETHNQEKKKKLEKEINRLTNQLENSINWAETEYYMEEVVGSSGDDFKWSVQMPEVMAEGGFDIVIANPPYQGLNKHKAEYLKDLSHFYDANLSYYVTIPRMRHDLYQKFNIRGTELLRENGIMTYITSDTFLTLGSKETSRRLLQNNRLVSLINANKDIFDATVKPAIFTLEKSYNAEKEYTTKFIDGADISKENYLQFIEYGHEEVYEVDVDIYRSTLRRAFFKPTSGNLRLHDKVMGKIKELREEWNYEIRDSDTLEENKEEIIHKHIDSLSEGDHSLLGLLTIGGQGLALGNTNKYVAYHEDSEKGQRIISNNEENFVYEKLNNEKIGRGKIGRVISDKHIYSGEINEEMKKEGLDNDSSWVPLEKNFKQNEIFYKDGYEYINWSKKSVQNMKSSSKVYWKNARFFFEEGLFVAIGGFADLYARYTNNSVIDNTGVFFKPLSDNVSVKYLLGLLNAEISSKIIVNFINHTGLQTTDLRYLPVIEPSREEKNEVENLVEQAIEKQKEEKPFEEIEEVKEKIDQKIGSIYGVELDG